MSQQTKKISEKEVDKEIDDVMGSKYGGERAMSLSENRGQLFVRIPQKITEELKLKKEHKLLFIVRQEGEKQYLEVQVIK